MFFVFLVWVYFFIEMFSADYENSVYEPEYFNLNCINYIL